LVKKIPTFKRENDKLEAYMYDKQKREVFPTSAWKATKYLKLIHGGICGLVETSLGVCHYFMFFINDYTRISWVYFLKENSEALQF
jgi:hypothetical protein